MAINVARLMSYSLHTRDVQDEKGGSCRINCTSRRFSSLFETWTAIEKPNSRQTRRTQRCVRVSNMCLQDERWERMGRDCACQQYVDSG
eukprot:4765132-Amphidinium_carterae.1